MKLFSLNKSLVATFFLLILAGLFVAPSGMALAASESTKPLEHAHLENVEFSCWGTTVLGVDVEAPIPNLTCIMAWISYSIMGVFAWIAGVFGVILNFAVRETVVLMGDTVNKIGAIPVAWSILRDIANVFLVFITLFMGIATILGISSYGYKQLFWRIIVAALFVNFSLFFTTIIIDVSNIAAINLYQGLTGAAGIDPGCAGAKAGDPACIKGGLSGAVMNGTKLTSAYDAVTLTAGKKTYTFSDNDDVHWNIVIASFMNGILFIVLAFVYAAAAILLVTRFVILIILMILSPIAFVAIITRVGGRKWWSMLLNQSFFAPALFLMLFIAMQIIASLAGSNFLGISKTSVAGAVGDVPSMSILLNYAVVIGFIILSLIVARSLGAYGAQTVIKTGQNWSRRAGMAAGATVGAATAGAGARLARGTVGRSAYERTQDPELLDKASQSGMRGRVARAQLGMYNKLSNSSYDVRGVAGKNAQKWTGGPIDTFEGARKKRIKQEENLQKQIGGNVLSTEQRDALGAAELKRRDAEKQRDRFEERVMKPQQEEIETLEKSLESGELNDTDRTTTEEKLKNAKESLAGSQARAQQYRQEAAQAREALEGAPEINPETGKPKKDKNGNIVYKKDAAGNELRGKRNEVQENAKKAAAGRVNKRADNVAIDGSTPYGTQTDIERRELADAGRKTLKTKDQKLLDDIRTYAKGEEGSSGSETPKESGNEGSSESTPKSDGDTTTT